MLCAALGCSVWCPCMAAPCKRRGMASTLALSACTCYRAPAGAATSAPTCPPFRHAPAAVPALTCCPSLPVLLCICARPHLPPFSARLLQATAAALQVPAALGAGLPPTAPLKSRPAKVRRLGLPSASSVPCTPGPTAPLADSPCPHPLFCPFTQRPATVPGEDEEGAATQPSSKVRRAPSCGTALLCFAAASCCCSAALLSPQPCSFFALLPWCRRPTSSVERTCAA